MSLGQISYAPTTEEELIWLAAANMDEHIKVATAIAASGTYHNQNLAIHPLDPIPITDLSAMDAWLRNHYDMHSDVNSVLGINGSDLSTVDFKEKAQLEAWSLLHFSEHQQWQQILGTT